MLLCGTFKLRDAEKFSSLGFDAIDIDFGSTIVEGEVHDSTLDGEDWLARVDAEKARLDQLGLGVNSCHLPFRYDYTRLDEPENLAKHQMVCRSLLAAERMGARWAIMHVDKKSPDPEASVANTVAYVKRLYADTGVKEISITIENSSHQLMEVAVQAHDRLKAEGIPVGFCLDVGHCHINRYKEYKDVPDAIRMLGDRIKMLHLHDNAGDYDMHTMPFSGTLPWEETMRTLKEVGYQGVFNYEISWSKMPVPLQKPMKDYCVEIARYLMGIFEEYQAT